MAIEHKKAVSKMPITVNEDMFDEVMAGLPLPASRAPVAGTSKRKAKDMAAKGLGRGRAIGRGGAHRKPKRLAMSPFIWSSEEDSDTSTVSQGIAKAMAPTATAPGVAPPIASSSNSPPRATASKAQPVKANPAKAIPLKVISTKGKAKPAPVPGSNEDMVRQAKAELRKPKKSK